MAKLWFRNSREQERVIAEADTFEEVSNAINDFLAAHNYKSYYIRMWEECDRTWFDVGSWSEFFIWDMTLSELNKKEVKNE